MKDHQGASKREVGIFSPQHRDIVPRYLSIFA